ncbi:MAG: FG-GAP repeat domain-containing protein [Candidatus Binatia bacterium]
MSRPRVAFVLTLLSALVLAPMAQAGINFIGAELTSVSPRPEYMVSGDLNNDGRADVVVVSPRSKELSVFLAADTPSRFAPARVNRFGTSLNRPAIGDLNADGNLDVVVADNADQCVWILVGNGDGTFRAPYRDIIPDSRNPFAVAIGNFNYTDATPPAPTRPDVAVTDTRLGKVFIRINTGATVPTFTKGGDYDVGLEPDDIKAADMNGDGYLDLVTLNQGGPAVKDVAVLLYERSKIELPEFKRPAVRYTVGEKPSSLVVADFTNDGVADVAMLNKPIRRASSDIDVLVNQGNGVLQTPVSISIGCPFFAGGQSCRALAMAAADFDDNGNLDVMVALVDPRRYRGSGASIGDAMQAFGGLGNGNFEAGPVFLVQKAPLSMATGDLSGDDKPDIALANQRTLSLQAFVNLSTPGTLGNGEVCSQGEECLSSRCINGVCCASQCTGNETCDFPGREGVCTPEPPNPPTECAQQNECDQEGDFPFCIDGYCCDSTCETGRCDAPGNIGLCVPLLPDGEVCEDGEQCATGICTDGHCCKEECADGYCDDQGVCRAPLPNGETCNLNEECESDVCDEFDGICCNERCHPVDEYCSVDGFCTPFEADTPTPTPNGQTPNVTEGTPTSTPTRTPRSTPAPTGELCSISSDCQTDFCVNGVCCSVAQCDANQHCAEGSGQCVAGGTPTTTRTPTRTATPVRTPSVDECGVCPKGTTCQIVPERGPVCISTSTGGGCSTGGGEAPHGGNLLVAMSMPLALWLGRRWQLKRAAVRVRSQRQ